ncbi:hypothetical protein J0H58_17540 [bacterium]|nr:hypothetical protein [bacterium]
MTPAGAAVERAVEWFVAVTAVAVGLSHLLRPADWAETFRRLHAAGRPGAFANGGLSLAVGAAVGAGHPTWEWPGGVITVFGWLLVAKGALYLLRPELGLRSMGRGADSPRGFVAGGAARLALGAWAGYCLWHGRAS